MASGFGAHSPRRTELPSAEVRSALGEAGEGADWEFDALGITQRC